MKYLNGLALLVVLAFGHTAQALELPDTAPTNMTLTVMVQPKEPKARYRLLLKPGGEINLFAFDYRNMQQQVTLNKDRKGDAQLVQALYSLSKAAIDSYQVDPKKNVSKEDEGGKKGSYSVSIIMRISSQMISVGDFVIDDLNTKPTFKALVDKIKKEFPELKEWPKGPNN